MDHQAGGLVPRRLHLPLAMEEEEEVVEEAAGLVVVVEEALAALQCENMDELLLQMFLTPLFFS